MIVCRLCGCEEKKLTFELIMLEICHKCYDMILAEKEHNEAGLCWIDDDRLSKIGP